MKGILLFFICLNTYASSELVAEVYQSLSAEIEEIYVLSNATQKREYGGIIVKNEDSYLLENITKGSSNSLSVYYGHSTEVTLAGEFHTHPYKYESLKNMPFSPRDFYNLHGYQNGSHIVQDYMSLIKAGEVYYAMVVEDVLQARAFWKNQDEIAKSKSKTTFDYLYKKYYSKNTGNDIIDIQINSLIYIMKGSGIKLYKIEDDLIDLLN